MSEAVASALEAFRACYDDPLRAAREWSAAGGKVVGYLCDNVPEELICAAGFFPLRVRGDPESGDATVRTKVDVLYTPDVTNRPPFAASMLNRLLDGTYSVLDCLIIPHNRNAIQAMFRELQDAQRADPSLRLPALHYLDKAWSPNYAAEAYNRDRIFDLRQVLETWSGAPISEAAVRDAISVANENRRLLGEVSGLRTASPPRLSGPDALAVIGSSMFMPKAVHNRLLADLLASAGELPAREGPKIILGGSPLDHAAVYEVIESYGATVVAEDHCWGARAHELPVDGEGDPMLALASRFHRKPACSIGFPLSGHVETCARRAAAASADAAIFYVMEQDWTQVWETPSEVKRLRAMGLPVLHLSSQAYAPDRGRLETEVRAFLASLGAQQAVGAST